MPQFHLTKKDLECGLLDLFAEKTSIFSSKGEARRMTIIMVPVLLLRVDGGLAAGGPPPQPTALRQTAAAAAGGAEGAAAVEKESVGRSGQHCNDDTAQSESATTCWEMLGNVIPVTEKSTVLGGSC